MHEKWQRIRFMPVTPLGEDGHRVTGSPEHIALSRRAAAEGMVLLKNDDHLLPLVQGSRIAVFGKAQADYVKGGGGSGDTTTAYVRSLAQGLQIKEEEGKITCFAPLTQYYAQDVARQYAAGTQPGRTVEPPLPQALLDAARAFTDTAVIALCRFSGEDYDRTGHSHDGDYFLSPEEDAMVSAVQRAFPRVAVVLNTGGIMDTLWFRENPAIGAALLAWQGGIEGGLAMADILVGNVCPSGHLTDTFAASFDAYPSSAGFAESDDYVEYQEDIFVGYRYFETIPGAADSVCYPFGYGLSYTSFSVTDARAALQANEQIVVTATVKNTGDMPGRYVAQVYCAPPRGRLSKPARVLVGFAKTRLLAPGECEAVRIAFAPYAFSSYDDEGTIARSAYVLERGPYTFHIGDHVRSTQEIPFCYHIPQDRVLQTLSARCAPTQLHRRMRSDGVYREIPCASPTPRAPYDAALIPFDGQYPDECPWPIPTSAWTDVERPQLLDVFEGKMTLDAFMDNLTDEEMVHLLGGQPNRGTAITFGFGNLPEYGIPNVMTADGPAGLRIPPDRGVCTTAFPCATLLACTWNTELVRQIGEAGAKEVRENGYGVWLTPAINIHRTPLCGRNFEYYAEDPLLAGKMAAAMVQGIQSQGVAASLKHFACNNKEKNRKESDSRVSERALREIYLKGFEICVREAQPMTVMSAYNLVNGQRASECRDLLTGILREEWGFAGVVTTDWYTHGEQYREIAAGNDIKMGRGMAEHTLAMLGEGRIARDDIRLSVRRLLEMILKLA